MSLVSLIVLGLAVAVGLVHAVVAEADDRAAAGRPVTIRPGAHGAPGGLWRHLLRRWLRPDRRVAVLAAPLVLALYVTAGVLRLAAVVIRLADLAAERAARRLDLWSNPNS